MKKIIKWWEPRIGGIEKRLVLQVLDQNYPNEGELTKQFEQKITALLGCKHALTVTSGTAAIYAALKALGIGYGDEVIVPDLTFIATANAVEMTGAKPVLVDVDWRTLCIDPQAIKKAVTRKTKAIIPVHVSGRGCRMEEILAIAKRYNCEVVEDAAEAFMSKHHGKYLGTWGRLGCFSFSPHKTITTGQGGVVVTDDDQLAVRLLELKDHGRRTRGTGGDDIHDCIGYNFKFTNLQAAVGLGQIHYLKKRIERMVEINETYRQHLAGLRTIQLFDFDIQNGEVPQWTDALLKQRDELGHYLKAKNVICRNYWFPLHTQQPYQLPDKNFIKATKLAQRAIWLPSAFTMSIKDVQYVCSLIRKFLKRQ